MADEGVCHMWVCQDAYVSDCSSSQLIATILRQKEEIDHLYDYTFGKEMIGEGRDSAFEGAADAYDLKSNHRLPVFHLYI
ncbi:hypothetical protein E4U53_001276 [Claviceps sorghi]|nr:hypothetical protein E4U53_001276 [Claviceps sorghi]